MRRGVLPLMVVAAAHPVPAVWLGRQDGDYSLLWVALPFVVLTLLAAAAAQLRWPVVALVLAALSFALAVAAVPVYLLGLLHLLQALVGVAVVIPRGQAES